MKLKVEHWPLARLKKYDRNARVHSDEQVAQLAASIKEFGFVNPVLVDDEGVLIAGHGRLAGAIAAGLDMVPVIKLGHLTEDQAKALRIADNRLPMSATWDVDLLRLELNDLSLAGYDMPLLGFDAPELVDFMTAPPPDGADPEKTPEPPEKPVSRTGDLWILGGHRIICGDSTNPDDVARVLRGDTPRLMATDPPYGVNYDADWRNSAQRKSGKPIGGRAVGKVTNDDRADWSAAYKLFPGDVAYIWHGALHTDVVVANLESCGLKRRALIVWAKNNIVVSRGDYHWQHETCWYVVRQGKPGGWAGDRRQSTLWQIDKPVKSETGHSTQKPVECMRRPIQNNSKPGDFVYEPFSGSGTTIIAAEMMKRRCLAIELSPAYVDVAVRRWQEFTKQTATLEGDGRTFDEIAKERAKGERNAKGNSRVAIRRGQRDQGADRPLAK
ncbi:MAG: site-specific DNA-methyltransferase [Patescibacteria group bacterium]|nr:site-specific DNA-methyltransferase [Patescibacteria group bacterium]